MLTRMRMQTGLRMETQMQTRSQTQMQTRMQTQMHTRSQMQIHTRIRAHSSFKVSTFSTSRQAPNSLTNSAYFIYLLNGSQSESIDNWTLETDGFLANQHPQYHQHQFSAVSS